jgi:mono/diheme cytochrome c family protein
MIRDVYFWIIALMVLPLTFYGCESRNTQGKLNPEQVLLGKELYLANGCAVCHGVLGDGKGVNAVQFTIKPTNFTDSKAYRHGTDTISMQNSIKYGIKEDDSVMPAFKHLTDQELEQISQYLKSLQKQET